MNYQYTPVSVDYYDEQAPGQGVFLMQQGMQRRVAVTLSHETGCEFEWTRVVDISIGSKIYFSFTYQSHIKSFNRLRS